MRISKEAKLEKKIKRKKAFKRKMRRFWLAVIFFLLGLCIIEPILENTIMEELNSNTAVEELMTEKVPEEYLPFFRPVVLFFSNTAFGKGIVEILLRAIWIALGFLIGRFRIL